MRTNKHGYVPAALLLNKQINELREHVEYEKFLCRVLADNDVTQEFKANTEIHQNRLYKIRFNNEKTENLTLAGKKKNGTK